MRRRKTCSCSYLDIVSNVLIVIFCILSLFPIYWLLTGSFKFSADVVKIPPDWFPRHWTRANYMAVFSKNPAWRWIFNSLFITVAATLGIVLVSSCAGYALSKIRFAGSKYVMYIVIASLLIPKEIYVLPLYSTVVRMGMQGTLAAIILPDLAMPFGVYLMKNFFDSIPNAIIEASQIDGCGRIRFFFTFGIPLSKAGVGALSILGAIRVWNGYLWQLLNSTTSKLSYTLPVGVAKLFDQTNGEVDYGLKFAAAVLSALPLFIIFLSFQRFFTAGVTSGSVKG